jgi:Flp pilus assembly protein TadG
MAGERRANRRVMRMHRGGEDGAVAVIVALLLTVFVGFSAVAIDLGSAWASKRQLVADLDAAALAGAYELLYTTTGECASGGAGDAEDAARQLAVDNGVDDTLIDSIDVDCSERSVTITAQREAITAFAPAMGMDELLAGAISTAIVTREDVGGVVPVAICEDDAVIDDFLTIAGGDPRDPAWEAHRVSEIAAGSAMYPTEDYGIGGPAQPYYGTPRAADHVVLETGFERSFPDPPCDGDFSLEGNWAWVNFTPPSANDLNDFIEDGADYGPGGHINLDPKYCGNDSPDDICPVETGKQNSRLNLLRNTWACAAQTDGTCPLVAFIVYSEGVKYSSNPPAGPLNRDGYLLKGILVGRLWDVRANAPGPANASLHIEPIGYSEVADPQDIDTIPQHLRVCRADGATNC